MTDKQIIIDGVDVSGCRFYSEKLSTMKGTGSISTIKCNGFCTHNIRGLDDSSCYDAHIEYAKCKNNNCYFKQLKRKEQECGELTSKCSQLRDELNFHIHNMNKQNEALHNENKQLKAQILDQEAETLKAGGIILKLKQTLAEIKEIVEQGVKIHEDIIVSKQILQKINEVENEKM